MYYENGISTKKCAEKRIICRKKMCNENNTYFMLETLTDFYMEPDNIWDRGSLVAIAPNSLLEIFGVRCSTSPKVHRVCTFSSNKLAVKVLCSVLTVTL